jgi:hypothetical protein
MTMTICFKRDSEKSGKLLLEGGSGHTGLTQTKCRLETRGDSY